MASDLGTWSRQRAIDGKDVVVRVVPPMLAMVSVGAAIVGLGALGGVGSSSYPDYDEFRIDPDILRRLQEIETRRGLMDQLQHSHRQDAERLQGEAAQRLQRERARFGSGWAPVDLPSAPASTPAWAPVDSRWAAPADPRWAAPADPTSYEVGADRGQALDTPILPALLPPGDVTLDVPGQALLPELLPVLEVEPTLEPVTRAVSEIGSHVAVPRGTDDSPMDLMGGAAGDSPPPRHP